MANIQRYTEKLNELKSLGNFRLLRSDIPNTMVNLSSNDYLSLKSNVELYEEFLDEISENNYHFTAASSRLLAGNSPEYTELENLLAKLYTRESALVFNSGYHANCGILPAIAGPKDLIIADKLVHASIIDGLKLGTAQYERFRHLDYEHLERILADNHTQYENIFIVTESIFSMDGDIADIDKLVKLKKKYNALLYVDEAHAIGVRGDTGLGITEETNHLHDCDFIVGTFGKALASVGAYVICDDVFKQYLVNHARTLIFTTALPPINLAWSYFILQHLHIYKSKRTHLLQTSKQFAKTLGIEAHSHIVPFVVGTNEDAISKSELLQNNGFFVLPIRYPTVAKDTARLRFSLQSDFSIKDLEKIHKVLL